MVEHGFNHVDESPTRSRGRFLELVGLGLLAAAGGVGGGLLADRLRPGAPAQPVAPTAQPAAPTVQPVAPAGDADDDQDADR
jgi:hypothetical protein